MDKISLKEYLLAEGWKLTDTGFDSFTSNGSSTDVKAIVRKLLDIDLKSVSQGTLPEDINRTKYESIDGGIVLQIQKVKNLSYPKYQETANPNPKILKFMLSDGVQNVQGLALESIPSLHLNSLPGSKILLTSQVDIAHYFLLLTKDNTTVLGGRVESMIEKWELNRKLAKHTRDNQEEGGPPPWIPFGQKITKPVYADKNFKSLEQVKGGEPVENSEFEAQRKDAIMEASKIGGTKVFGGGNHKLLDHNVQVIVDAGFTMEQAEYALKLAKNNPDRALRNLQQRNARQGEKDGGKGEEKPERVEKGKGKGAKGRGRDQDGNPSQKPSAKVSLFDFLEDKLPATEKESIPSFQPVPSTGFQNHDKRINKSTRNDDRHPRQFFDKNGFDSKPNNSGGPYKSHLDKKPFSDHQRSDRDRSFGNFKVNKHEFTAKTDVGRIGPKWSEKRTPKPIANNIIPKSSPKPEPKPFEEEKKTNFPTAGNEQRPPRFQKSGPSSGGNQPSLKDNAAVAWNDTSSSGYPSLPGQTEFKQLRTTMDNLTLQPTNQQQSRTSPEQPAPPANINKNIFYQNMSNLTNMGVRVPAAPRGNDVLMAGPPPSVPPQHQHHAPAYPRRSPAAPTYVQPQEIKTATHYATIPGVSDFPIRTNGTLMPGFNDFQAVFGNARTAPNSFMQPPTVTYNSPPPPQPPSNYKNPSAATFNPTKAFQPALPPQQLYSNGPPPAGFATAQPPNAFTGYAPAAFLTAQAMMQSAHLHQPQPRRWKWEKGHKCFARYWEDQNYYEAIVTGVAENTCVVQFTEYGNFEEVLHDDCVPIDGIPTDT